MINYALCRAQYNGQTKGSDAMHGIARWLGLAPEPQPQDENLMQAMGFEPGEGAPWRGPEDGAREDAVLPPEDDMVGPSPYGFEPPVNFASAAESLPVHEPIGRRKTRRGGRGPR